MAPRLLTPGRTAAAVALLAVLLGAAPARAAFVFTTEHVDIGLLFDNGQLGVEYHDETNDIEYEAADALVLFRRQGIVAAPADPAFAFLGAAAGAPVWLLPEFPDPNAVLLGVGAEEIAPGTFDGPLTLTLVGFSGPGQFSAWVDNLGVPLVAAATSDGLSAADAFTVIEGAHTDYNWALTAAGTYTLTFEATGTVGGVSFTSGPVEFTFVAQAVPEPASAALLGLAVPALAYLRRRAAR